MSQDISLQVQIGRLTLPNPIMVASGTFGYAREMQNLVDTSRLGGILPKTITQEPRAGNAPPRTVETTAGLLNSIGLDNDGIDAFIDEKMPTLAAIGSPIVVSIAGRRPEEFVAMAERLEKVDGVAALELNISCPNVTGGIDYGTNPKSCSRLIAGVRAACELPILAKLTPNVTDITEMAQAVADGGADGVSLINTCLGMAIDWRNRKPRLGNVMGGLSGPAIKPIALRMVYQVARAVEGLPIVGIGGIETIDDAMEFFVAGATAVQVGTASFYRPQATMEILDALPAAIETLGAKSIQEVVGMLRT
ncbi:MAG: dihydroorotate dehydrogenase [Planctomycetia bacterium]